MDGKPGEDYELDTMFEGENPRIVEARHREESHRPVRVSNAAQDRGSFWFSYILNEFVQHIEIWNEFKD